MSYRVALQYRRLSAAVIRNALMHVQVSVLRHKRTGKRYVLPSKAGGEAKKIYSIMKVKRTTSAYALD